MGIMQQLFLGDGQQPHGVAVLTTVGLQTWTPPAGVNMLLSVEGISAGGIQLGSTVTPGGGGGSYAKTTNLAIAYGQTIYARVGDGTGATVFDTWLNISANSAPSSTAQGMLAAGPTVASPSTGGQAASCIGNVAYSGGNGGTATIAAGYPQGGGGGAAGPDGPGRNGGNAVGATSGDGGSGGGADGLSSTAGATGGNGGNGPNGTGGGAAATSSTAATAGTDGGGGGATYATAHAGAAGAGGTHTIAAWGNGYGPGGGGGGGIGSYASGVGGAYGGGGGGASNGGNGIIVITY